MPPVVLLLKAYSERRLCERDIDAQAANGYLLSNK